MGRRSPQTQAKRERALAKTKKREEKLARRAQRKAAKAETSSAPHTQGNGGNTDDPISPRTGPTDDLRD
jgi:hypothetical protein